MEVRFLGHASIYIKTEHVSIVTDPWFSRRGAFLWSWFQFPDNTELDLGFFKDVDYVVLSHEHQDHFDVPFLKTLSPATKVVIPQYTDTYLFDTLRANIANEVIVCPTLQKLQLGDVTFRPVVQSVPFWDDCTLIFDTPDGTIIDVNDMKLGSADAEWITRHYPEPLLLFLQYSGATYFPYAYEMPQERKVELAQRRVRSKFHGVKQMFGSLNARYLVPCAGPAAFLDESQFALNFAPESIFPSQADFYAYAEEEGFAERTLILLPGQAIDFGRQAKEQSLESLQDRAFTDRTGYLADYRERRKELIAEGLASLPDHFESLVPRFQEFLEPLLASSPFFRRKIGGAVLFDLGGSYPEQILVDFRRVRGACKAYEGEAYFYRFTIDGRILALYLNGQLHFDQLLLSLRFKARREPDVFNEYLFMFLRFADPASYAQIQRYEEQRAFDERFELDYGGERYSVQRYCPHAMGDLSKGEVEDGALVCPNHGWRFSLETGEAQRQMGCIAIDRIGHAATGEGSAAGQLTGPA
ncbi:hypothetical protein AYO38_02045 [bacterium SCGC AG-212-C10]|nr:hypothetical protein AYO38_02045 [bacterium SCGC AG-212-C10]